MVGALQYATLTHPEISYSVNKACQFMHSPTTTHWQLVKRILRHLKGIVSYSLFLKKFSNLTLIGFADAIWALTPMIESLHLVVVFILEET